MKQSWTRERTRDHGGHFVIPKALAIEGVEAEGGAQKNYRKDYKDPHAIDVVAHGRAP